MGKLRAEVPPEITEFKEKFFFGLTVRQLICAAGALLLAVPTGIYGSKFLPKDVVEWAVFIEAVPFAAIGFFRYNDMPCEKFIKKFGFYFLCSQKRKFKYVEEPLVVKLGKEIKDFQFQVDAEDSKILKKQAKMIKKMERKQSKMRTKGVKTK